MSDRTTPPPTTSERRLVALCLQRQGTLDHVSRHVAPESMLNPVMAGIYGAIMAMSDAGAQVNNVTVTRRLIDTGKLETLGGAGLIAELFADDVMVSERDDLIAQVLADYYTRQTQAAGLALAAARDPADSANAFARVDSLRQGDADADEAISDAIPWGSFDPMFAELAESIGNSMSLPEIGACVAAHVIFGGMLGKALSIELSPSWHVWGNIYAIGAGDSASGKSATSKPLMSEALLLDAKIMAMVKADKVRLNALLSAEKAKLEKTTSLYAKGAQGISRADVEAAAQAVADAEALRPAIGQLVIQDATGEAAAAACADGDGAIMSLAPEARQAIAVLLGRYTSGHHDVQMWLSGSCGDDVKVNRKGSGVLHIQAPCISAMWFTQPDLLAKILSDEILSDAGYTRRILTFNVPTTTTPPVRNPPPIDHGLMEHYRNRLAHALYLREPDADNNSPETRTCKLSTAAADLLHEIRCEKKREQSDPFSAAYVEFVGKWALILHAAQYGPDRAAGVLVDLATVTRADGIMRWFAANRRASAAAAPQMPRLSALAKNASIGGFAVRDAQKISPQLTADQARIVCGQWCAAGFVEARQALGRNRRNGVRYHITDAGWKLIRDAKI